MLLIHNWYSFTDLSRVYLNNKITRTNKYLKPTVLHRRMARRFRI